MPLSSIENIYHYKVSQTETVELKVCVSNVSKPAEKPIARQEKECFNTLVFCSLLKKDKIVGKITTLQQISVTHTTVQSKKKLILDSQL